LLNDLDYEELDQLQDFIRHTDSGILNF